MYMYTLGEVEQHFGLYIEVAFIEGLFCTAQTGTWVPGRYIAVGFYSGVAVKRSSTVDLLILNNSYETLDTIFNENNLSRST